MTEIDLDRTSVRELNQQLHDLDVQANHAPWRILNPRGKHALAVGLRAPVDLVIDGHVGYYCAGMNTTANITVTGHCGWGVGENIMSGLVRIKGNASEAAGASGRGGLVVIEGDASSRCGISMKGVDIVVGGSVGHMSAFMAQKGRLVICGDADEDLGDSIYEAIIFLRGKTGGLGSDCVEKDMTAEHAATLEALLARAQIDADPRDFRRYGSARKLYNFDVDHAGAY
jgi:glutamate synthase domain-containing protein 3